jgi:hypothetical protein
MDRSGLNPQEPHIARMYDYYVGGEDRYPADAEAAEKVLQALPEVRPAAQANRWRPPIEPAKSMDAKVPGYAAAGRKS